MIPYIFVFNEKIFLYPFMMGAAWGVGYHLSKVLNEKYKNFKSFNVVFLGIFLSSWIGSKVFYLLTVDTSMKNEIAQTTNFWLGGGFVFYGGLIGALTFVIIYNKTKKTSWGDFNIFIPSLLIGHAIGRVGCFLAGCCFGTELSKKYFFSHFLHGAHRFPVQLLESVLLIIGSVYFIKCFKNRSLDYVLNYFFFYAVVRFITELYRGDLFRGIWFDLISTSQIISLALVLVFLIYKAKSLNKISSR